MFLRKSAHDWLVIPAKSCSIAGPEIDICCLYHRFTSGSLRWVVGYVIQDELGQISNTHSVSAGLDYPGVGPELAYWKESNLGPPCALLLAP